MNDYTQIGWFVTDEDQIVHYQGYETASWWTEYELKAGKYPVMRYNRNDGWRGWVHINLNGITVHDYFVSRLFWAESVHSDQHVGHPFKHTINLCTSEFGGPGDMIACDTMKWSGKRVVPAGHFEFFDFVGFEQLEGIFYTKNGQPDPSRPMYRTTYNDNDWRDKLNVHSM